MQVAGETAVNCRQVDRGTIPNLGCAFAKAVARPLRQLTSISGGGQLRFRYLRRRLNTTIRRSWALDQTATVFELRLESAPLTAQPGPSRISFIVAWIMRSTAGIGRPNSYICQHRRWRSIRVATQSNVRICCFRGSRHVASTERTAYCAEPEHTSD